MNDTNYKVAKVRAMLPRRPWTSEDLRKLSKVADGDVEVMEYIRAHLTADVRKAHNLLWSAQNLFGVVGFPEELSEVHPAPSVFVACRIMETFPSYGEVAKDPNALTVIFRGHPYGTSTDDGLASFRRGMELLLAYRTHNGSGVEQHIQFRIQGTIGQARFAHLMCLPYFFKLAAAWDWS